MTTISNIENRGTINVFSDTRFENCASHGTVSILASSAVFSGCAFKETSVILGSGRGIFVNDNSVGGILNSNIFVQGNLICVGNLTLKKLFKWEAGEILCKNAFIKNDGDSLVSSGALVGGLFLNRGFLEFLHSSILKCTNATVIN
jgi:hypothetical protein